MSTLHAYINVEAAGSSGPAVLFEAGPGNGWLTAPGHGAHRIRAAARSAIEIYKRLPNDTDFTMLARQNIPGLNFAAVGDGYAYHTARDVPDRLAPRGAARRPARTSWRSRRRSTASTSPQRDDAERTFFDIGRCSALSYWMIVGWIIAAACAAARRRCVVRGLPRPRFGSRAPAMGLHGRSGLLPARRPRRP